MEAEQKGIRFLNHYWTQTHDITRRRAFQERRLHVLRVYLLSYRIHTFIWTSFATIFPLFRRKNSQNKCQTGFAQILKDFFMNIHRSFDFDFPQRESDAMAFLDKRYECHWNWLGVGFQYQSVKAYKTYRLVVESLSEDWHIIYCGLKNFHRL